ncbi:hypothetical protein RQP46_006797 [Phenoliferia psychrophenolica]
MAQDSTLWARREARALEALEGVRESSTPMQLLKLKAERDACKSDLIAERQQVQILNKELDQLRASVSKLSSQKASVEPTAQPNPPSDQAKRALEAEKRRVTTLENKIRLLEKERLERQRESSSSSTVADRAAERSPGTELATDATPLDDEEMRRVTEELEAQLRASEERLEVAESWVSHLKSEAKVGLASEKEWESELAASTERIEDLKRACAAYDKNERAAATKSARVATSHATELASLQGQVDKAVRERDEVLARFTPPPGVVHIPASDDCLIRALGISEDQLVACIDLWRLPYESLIPRLLTSTFGDIASFEKNIGEWEEAAEVELPECRLKLAAFTEVKVSPPSPNRGKGTEQALRKRCAYLEGNVRLLRVELEKKEKEKYTRVVGTAPPPPKKLHKSIGTQTNLIQEPTSAVQGVAMKRLASNVSRLNEVITTLRSENTTLLLQLAGV